LGVHRQPEVSQAAGTKPHHQVTGHPRFFEYLERLKKSKVYEEREIARHIADAIDVLEENLTAGDIIQRERWPESYRVYERVLGLNNLRRYVIDGGRRMVYSQKGGRQPRFRLDSRRNEPQGIRTVVWL
jgi:hypothetical protein